MMNQLNYAYGRSEASGKIKVLPEDFCVIEELGFSLTGEGEHLFLQVEKEQLTTEEVAKNIAKALQIPSKSISYAGLKDKQGVTTQWFSLHLPGKSDPDLGELNTDNSRVLQAIRHDKKLKTGALKSNYFKIRVRDFECKKEALLERMTHIQTKGVPNYFGPQRFGHEGSNIERAKKLLLENKRIKNRYLRGIYYSTARALLFNEIVSLRVQEGCWNQPIVGDLMMLAGTNSIFHAEKVDETLLSRARAHDVAPAAALWGEGGERLSKEALDLQAKALQPWQDWCTALETHGLRKAYRSMVLVPQALNLEDDVLTFRLPKGTFATTLLRELISFTEGERYNKESS